MTTVHLFFMLTFIDDSWRFDTDSFVNYLPCFFNASSWNGLKKWVFKLFIILFVLVMPDLSSIYQFLMKGESNCQLLCDSMEKVDQRVEWVLFPTFSSFFHHCVKYLASSQCFEDKCFFDRNILEIKNKLVILFWHLQLCLVLNNKIFQFLKHITDNISSLSW